VSPTEEIEGILAEVGAEGFLRVVDIDGGAELSIRPDEPAVTASVFKLPVMVELATRFAERTDDPKARVRIGAGSRTQGPVGLSVMRDETELSVRDLAYLMMALSDNHATDVLCARLGIDAVNARMRRLGLVSTHLEGDCEHLFATMAEDLGVDSLAAALDVHPNPYTERLHACRSVNPATANRSTARDMTELIGMLWRDEVGPDPASRYVRMSMSVQFGSNALWAPYPDPAVHVFAKSGSLPHWRNEVGAIVFPDGRRFAVAIFLRLSSPGLRQAAAGTAIGRIAVTAIDALSAA
jgi:beta-lactamase class A